MQKKLFLLVFTFILIIKANAQENNRAGFNSDWKFYLGDDSNAKKTFYNDVAWRSLSLPHDWSIEGKFDQNNPSGVGGGALPGGVGWYRKSFMVPLTSKDKNIFIDFDGVYRLSKVWINGHYLGERPNGYISFRYDLTSYLKFGYEKNEIAVRVDNSQQPNSRWYSGSGIYRNVWLVTTGKIFVDNWGTCITTPQVDDQSATIVIDAKINNTTNATATVSIKTLVYDSSGKLITAPLGNLNINAASANQFLQKISIVDPNLWSIDRPYLYKAVTQVISDGNVVDEYTTNFGIRYFHFDADKGFFLNGKHVEIQGVCDHQDLGALGSAVNTRAIQRQLEILKGMGCNAIRTSHNPPAPELLDLCDKMGFIVMDEAFDMWKRPKTKYDYHLYWDQWHVQDLSDQILRDRNHPSVFIWSVGNEIPEQSAYVWNPSDPKSHVKDSTGKTIVKELVSIVRSLDSTRPVTTANDHVDTSNLLLQTGVLDLICFNYRQLQWPLAQQRWGKKSFIATEAASAFETRGVYYMPSDSIRLLPKMQGFIDKTKDLYPDLTASSYDNFAAWWGSTHEQSLKILLKYPFMAGLFIWSGFDYIGEPTPFQWPARSSYFGVIDLAGFPKDAYYLYQSLWTDKPMLHILPHWNWKTGDTVDVWAYYNNADEVELFLNGKSLGIKKKLNDDLHVMWRIPYEPGTLKAVSRKDGSIVLTDSVRTAGAPAKIILSADRSTINADGNDLSYVTVKIVDAKGNLVPNASNDVQFRIVGEASIAGVDNGSETSMESFKANHRKAFNGLCLAIVQSKNKPSAIQFSATSLGLQPATLVITSK
jgi:beta-galactosidase